MEPYAVQPLPITDLDYRRLLRPAGEANAALARYDGLLQGIVNPGVLLSPMTTQEAVLSSKIEGTQTTLDEVLEHDAGMQMDAFKAQDIQEVVNYRQALVQAAEVVTERPITLALIREMHRILLNSVRGQDKSPGEFRREQNWIGAAGCTIEEATFVPVSPFHLQSALVHLGESLQTFIMPARHLSRSVPPCRGDHRGVLKMSYNFCHDALDALVAYIQDDGIDPLLQLAVVHA